MNEIKNIVLQNNYTPQSFNKFIKKKSAYTSVMKFLDEDKKYVTLVFKRIYYNNRKFVLINEKRRKTKLINHIESILNNEAYCGDKVRCDDLVHCELYCFNCEENIENAVLFENFCDRVGFVAIHKTECGKCIIMIDENTSNIVMRLLNNMKMCSECVVQKIK